MKREIKFRFWVDNKMRYDPPMPLIEGSYLNSNIDYLQSWGILMQFTGMFDKNNKEIYEGDIVEINSKIAKTFTKGIIYYNEKTCAFMVDDIIFKQYIPITYEDKIEVIGNIFENKELLSLDKL